MGKAEVCWTYSILWWPETWVIWLEADEIWQPKWNGTWFFTCEGTLKAGQIGRDTLNAPLSPISFALRWIAAQCWLMNAVMLSVNSACLAVYQSSPGEIKHIIIPCIYIIIYIGRIWKNCVFYTWDCPASAWGKQSFCSFIWVARCCTAALFAALVTQVFHGSAFCICKEPRGLTNNAKFLTAQETS